MFTISDAKRQQRPFKVSLEGVSGSGKTFSALRLAFAMRRAGIGSRIVVADSENSSAEGCQGEVVDGEKWEFKHCPIPPAAQNPDGYTAAYEYCVGKGYDLIIFDSLSHAWHGAMDQIDKISRTNRGDKYQAWGTVTPAQRKMLATLTDPRAHLIATMRVKSEYERVTGNNGKEKLQKIGTKTDQREGSEYEFDCVVRLEKGNLAEVEKVRGCTAMTGRSGELIGPDFWKPLFDWWLAIPTTPATPPPPAPKLDPVLWAQMMNFMEKSRDEGELKPHFQAFHISREKFTPEQYTEGESLKNRLKEKFAAEVAAKAATTVPPVTTGEPSNAERLANCRTWLAANIASFDADAFPEKVVKFLDDKFATFATYTPGELERAILAKLPESARLGELLPAELVTARKAVTEFAATLMAK